MEVGSDKPGLLALGRRTANPDPRLPAAGRAGSGNCSKPATRCAGSQSAQATRPSWRGWPQRKPPPKPPKRGRGAPKAAAQVEPKRSIIDFANDAIRAETDPVARAALEAERDRCVIESREEDAEEAAVCWRGAFKGRIFGGYEYDKSHPCGTPSGTTDTRPVINLMQRADGNLKDIET